MVEWKASFFWDKNKTQLCMMPSVKWLDSLRSFYLGDSGWSWRLAWASQQDSLPQVFHILVESDNKQTNKVICVSDNLALINDRETKYSDIKATGWELVGEGSLEEEMFELSLESWDEAEIPKLKRSTLGQDISVKPGNWEEKPPYLWNSQKAVVLGLCEQGVS